ncbi:MAG: Fe-S cluster protein, partial [Deltaproteobacteria bacterium]|nr:Fe-S cluster protein [Deltaproteobacteria bacterium]
MTQFNNTMEIFKLLDKSNCKECNKPTCLAFAAAVFQGQKRLNECPHLDREAIGKYDETESNQMTMEQERDEAIG